MTTSSTNAGHNHTWGWRHVFGAVFALAFLYEVNHGHDNGFLGSIWAAAVDAGMLVVSAWVVLGVSGLAYYGVKRFVEQCDIPSLQRGIDVGVSDASEEAHEGKWSIFGRRTIQAACLIALVIGLGALLYRQIDRMSVEQHARDVAAAACMTAAAPEANKIAQKFGRKPRLAVVDVRLDDDSRFYRCVMFVGLDYGAEDIDREYWEAGGLRGGPATLYSARILGEEQVQ